jgi:hypothetical protein
LSTLSLSSTTPSKFRDTTTSISFHLLSISTHYSPACNQPTPSSTDSVVKLETYPKCMPTSIASSLLSLSLQCSPTCIADEFPSYITAEIVHPTVKLF